MAKFVVAGSCECPYYAKAELLADELAINLPEFKIHKIVKSSEDWPKWLNETCESNGWSHGKSPIIWRELVDRGGKGSLLGGFNEFLEYAQCYYGVTSNIMTDLMLKMKDENVKTSNEKAEEEKYYQSLIKPIHVCVTSAAGPTAYNLIEPIVNGEIFGKDVEVSLRLLDTEENMEVLKGVEMETADLAYPLLRKLAVTSNPEVGFKDASAVFILDELPFETIEGQMESRQDWLKRNAKLFETYGEALNNHALADVKVLVAGEGPVNFNTHVLIEKATNLLKQNIVAASRLQERRARALLASKLKVNSAGVKDATIWGDCSYDGAERIHVDVNSARCQGYDGAVWGPTWFSRSVVEMVHDNKWISTDFISDLQKHDEKLKEALNHRTSTSAASALASLMRDWVQGSKDEEIFSLGVESEGWYGIKNCVFSLPVRFSSAGSYQVVWDMKLDEETKVKLTGLEKELKKDLQAVFSDEEMLDTDKKFDENSELISSMQLSASPSKTPGGDKLEKIEEEEGDEDTAAKEEKEDASKVSSEEKQDEKAESEAGEPKEEDAEEKTEEEDAPTEEVAAEPGESEKKEEEPVEPEDAKEEDAKEEEA